MTKLDELLEIIAKAEAERTVENVKPKKGQTQVDRFVSDLKVQHGLDRVPTHVIFYTYRNYKEDKNAMNKIVFFRLFNKMFKQVRSGIQRYYLLDGSSFDLTREGKLKAKHYEENYKKRREQFKKRKEANKKAKREVSESEEGSESKA